MKRSERSIEVDVRHAVLTVYPDAVLEFIEPYGNGLSRPRWRLVSRKFTLTEGVADVRVHRTGYTTVHCELKTEDGKQRESQARFEEVCDQLGWPYFVCRSASDVLAAVSSVWSHNQ